MEPITLALDLGTSEFKAGIFAGVKPTSPVQSVPVVSRVRGVQVELEPAHLNGAIKKLLWKFRGKLHKVDRIIFANQSPSLTVLSKNGTLLCPVITHLDRRSPEEAKILQQGLGADRWLNLAGNLPYPGGIAASGIFWIRRNRAALFRQAVQFGCLNTYYLKLWGNVSVIDPGNASYMGLYRTNDLGGWNEEFCDFVGIKSHQLPEVREAHDVAGFLEPQVARMFGLRASIPLLVGTIDTSAALLAQDLLPGDILHIGGASDVLVTPLTSPVPSDRYLMRGVGVGKQWIAARTVAAGGSTLDWCEKVFHMKNSRELFLAEKEKTDATFVVDPQSAGFTGISLATTRNQLLAAVMQALREESLKSLEAIRSVSPLTGRVLSTGSNQRFARWLHRSWQKELRINWKFRYEPEIGLKGLARLASSSQY